MMLHIELNLTGSVKLYGKKKLIPCCIKDKCIRLAKENETDLLSHLKLLDQNLSYKSIDDEINISEIKTVEIGYEKYKSMFYTVSVSPIMSLIMIGDNDNCLVHMNTEEYLIELEKYSYTIRINHTGKNPYDNFFNLVMLTIKINGNRLVQIKVDNENVNVVTGKNEDLDKIGKTILVEKTGIRV